ncbi:MAG TPA: hypothetical protein GX392_07195 [Clostridiales bacterium]|nr:hypothetical protein [Clostridiales bacterium]
MKNWLKIEIKRLVHRWQTWVGIILFLGMVVLSSYFEYIDRGVNGISDGYNMYLSAIGSPLHSYMSYAIFLVVLLIWGNSFFEDFHSAVFNYSMTRIEAKEYFKKKTLSLMVLAFIGMLVLQILAISTTNILGEIWYSNLEPDNLGGILENAELRNFSPPVEYMPELFENMPILYIVIIALILAIISIEGTLLGTLFSMIFKNNLGIIFVPWLSIIVIGILTYSIAPYTSEVLAILSPIIMSGDFIFGVEYVGGISLFYPFIYWIMICVITSIAIYWVYKKKIEEMLSN